MFRNVICVTSGTNNTPTTTPKLKKNTPVAKTNIKNESTTKTNTPAAKQTPTELAPPWTNNQTRKQVVKT